MAGGGGGDTERGLVNKRDRSERNNRREVPTVDVGSEL